MSSNYPRSGDTFTDKTNQGTQITAEEHVIPSTAPYNITLDNIPLGPVTQADGTQSTTTLSVGGFTEITSGSPSRGQFIANYETGVLTYNSADASTLTQNTYETAGDKILAEHINNLQDGTEAMQTDLLGSHKWLKAVLSVSATTTIDIFGGSYSLGGVIQTYAGATGLSHVDWAVAGTYRIYFDSGNTLVLNGASFPDNSIPICTIVTATGGVITSLVDGRIQLSNSSSGGSMVNIYKLNPVGAGTDTLTSGSYTDISGVELSFTLSAISDILVMASYSISSSNVGAGIPGFKFYEVNSATEIDLGFQQLSVNTSPEIVTMTGVLESIPAGAVVVRGQWVGGAATTLTFTRTYSMFNCMVI